VEWVEGQLFHVKVIEACSDRTHPIEKGSYLYLQEPTGFEKSR
jgi:hypothetical protein